MRGLAGGQRGPEHFSTGISAYLYGKNHPTARHFLAVFLLVCVRMRWCVNVCVRDKDLNSHR
jgi:hypothetical protein